jgi:ribosome-associated protein
MSPAPPTRRPEPPAPAPDDEEEDGSGRRSYKDRKAESISLTRLAKALVDMKPSAVAELPLPDDVREVVAVARGMERVARVRELKRVVSILRSHGIVSLDAMERDAGRARRQKAARERDYEAWRERLVSEGDAALTELVARHPAADAQRLRQLLRQAQRDPTSEKAKLALRSVLRLVRQACEADGTPPPEGSTGDGEAASPDGVADDDEAASEDGVADDDEAASEDGPRDDDAALEPEAPRDDDEAAPPSDAEPDRG